MVRLMGLDPTGAMDDEVGIETAALLLEVGPEQVRAMAEEGLLTPITPIDDAAELRFSRAEVLAARNLGG